MASEKGRRFSHLKWKNRLKIEQMLREGHTVREIADALHVHNSTIYREINRGLCVQRTSELIDREIYCPDVAENRYQENLRAKGPELKIGNDHALAGYIEHMISEEKYSPGAVLDKIKEDGIEFAVSVSRWTIYQYITKGVFLTITNRSLPSGGRKKQQHRKVRAAHLPKGDSIEDRPAAVAARTEFGNWEMDTVESGKRGKHRLLVLTERKTRKEIVIRMADGTTKSVVDAMDRMERRLGSGAFRRLFRTITVDNGSEFADCRGLERSCLVSRPRTHLYYCHPYSAFERGSNENLNRMIRRWLPKGTDFSKVSDAQVRRIEAWINGYPRGVLGGRSAQNVFRECAEQAGIAGCGKV